MRDRAILAGFASSHPCILSRVRNMMAALSASTAGLDVPFKCKVPGCDKTIVGLPKWVDHVLDHDSTRGVPFQCCKTRFNTYCNHWVTHLTTSHDCGSHPIWCTDGTCSKSFSGISDLRTHLRTKAEARKKKNERGNENEMNGTNSNERLSPLTTVVVTPSVHHWQSDPTYSAFPTDLRSLARGDSKAQGATAHDALTPFQSLLSKLPPVKRIVQDSGENIDAARSLHWATKDHIPFSGSKLTELVVRDMNSGPSAKFLSGHLVNSVESPSPRMLDARVISQMIVPDPNSAELTYAANIDGQSKDFQVHLPSVLSLQRHFDADDIAGKYSSNMTPQGIIVDLHRGIYPPPFQAYAIADVLHTEWTCSRCALTGNCGCSFLPRLTTSRFSSAT